MKIFYAQNENISYKTLQFCIVYKPTAIFICSFRILLRPITTFP